MVYHYLAWNPHLQTWIIYRVRPGRNSQFCYPDSKIWRESSLGFEEVSGSPWVFEMIESQGVNRPYVYDAFIIETELERQ